MLLIEGVSDAQHLHIIGACGYIQPLSFFQIIIDVQVSETTSCVKNRARLCTIHQNGGTPSRTLRMREH